MISIHALREEGDAGWRSHGRTRSYFYPRPPRGGRPLFSVPQREGILISIHALREEGDDGFYIIRKLTVTISIHALREEGDGPQKHRQRQTV